MLQQYMPHLFKSHTPVIQTDRQSVCRLVFFLFFCLPQNINWTNKILEISHTYTQRNKKSTKLSCRYKSIKFLLATLFPQTQTPIFWVCKCLAKVRKRWPMLGPNFGWCLWINRNEVEGLWDSRYVRIMFVANITEEMRTEGT